MSDLGLLAAGMLVAGKISNVTVSAPLQTESPSILLQESESQIPLRQAPPRVEVEVTPREFSSHPAVWNGAQEIEHEEETFSASTVAILPKTAVPKMATVESVPTAEFSTLSSSVSALKGGVEEPRSFDSASREQAKRLGKAENSALSPTMGMVQKIPDKTAEFQLSPPTPEPSTDSHRAAATITLESLDNQPIAQSTSVDLPMLGDPLSEGTSVDSLSAEEEAMSQVTSVDQLSDVSPTDWAYESLRNLIERYGVVTGYPDSTFRGSRALTRYEFAAALNATLNKISQIQLEGVSKEDLQTLQRLQEEYSAELAELRGRVDSLEARTTFLEDHQFSTTTRLFGQAIFGLQGSNEVDVDLFPRDGEPERSGKAELNLAGNAQLSLATSFTGRDLLLTGLQAGNLASSASVVFTNMGRLATESDTNNDLILTDLSYRFPISSNFGIVVGPAGINPANTFRGINPLEGEGTGAISLLGQRNPILTIGNGTGGIGFDWQISRALSLQGVYSAESPSFTADSDLGGLFGGRTSAGVQLTIAPTNNLDIGLHYIYSHSPDGFLGIGTGDNQLVSPLAPIIAPTTSLAFNTHAVGATLAWRVNPRWTLGTWGGLTFSNPVELSGSVETTNWMVFSAFPDLLGKGNLGGILFGQPPKITSSTLPDGFNFPNSLGSDLSGTPGGRDDTSYHLELFYRAKLTERISLTPGVLVIFNPDHNAANDTLLVGTVRATFQF